MFNVTSPFRPQTDIQTAAEATAQRLSQDGIKGVLARVWPSAGNSPGAQGFQFTGPVISLEEGGRTR